MEEQVIRQLQLTELEMLKKIDAVCLKYHIRYYMVGGTLLGAVRHKGFIPWDDDLDVAMPREDYNRFLEVCRNGALGQEYFLQHYQTEPCYGLFYAKVRKNNTIFDEPHWEDSICHKGIFVDVFPLDHCSRTDGIFYRMKAFLVKRIIYIMNLRTLNLPRASVINRILLTLSRLVSLKTLCAMGEKLASSGEQGKYYINYGSNYKYWKQTMPVEIYDPPVKIPFEDGEFSAPAQYISWMERIFGNWKELPPVEERLNHNPARVIFNIEKKTGGHA